jgi:L-ascorbate metabolism protein UlaG (beta-lactamase superfamily)
MPALPRLTFLGHSTVLVEMGGRRILTDPVLLDRVIILRRVGRRLDPGLVGGIDTVLISHLHLDHLHLPSIRLLGPGVHLVVPAGSAAWFRARGFGQVVELAPGDRAMVGPVTVTATPAVHSGFHPPFGPRAMAVGYLLEFEAARIYFAGDTDVFDGMADFGGEGLDVALLPVWGWGPRLGPGHMNPRRAARALGLLRARYAVPIHWGTLWPFGLGRVVPHRLSQPPLEFAHFARRYAPGTRVLLVAPGSPVVFDPGQPGAPLPARFRGPPGLRARVRRALRRRSSPST